MQTKWVNDIPQHYDLIVDGKRTLYIREYEQGKWIFVMHQEAGIIEAETIDEAKERAEEIFIMALLEDKV